MTITTDWLTAHGFAIRADAYQPVSEAPWRVHHDGITVSVRRTQHGWQAKHVGAVRWMFSRIADIAELLAVCERAGITWTPNGWRLTDDECIRRRRDAESLSRQFGEGRTYDYTRSALADSKPGHFSWGSSPTYTGD